VQQAVLQIPSRNAEGKPQQITFNPPAEMSVGTGELKLAATSDSGLPVSYYVREGPAEIDGDVLKLTNIPPRAKWPLKLTVVAWQWGRSTEPKVQSADPVVRTIELGR
jgi:hypothetical protein